MKSVGVLALQGDVREHLNLLDSLGVATAEVKKPQQLELVDALVIPGGESTTIGKMAVRFGLFEPLRLALDRDLLGPHVPIADQPLLGSLDVLVRRNAFGRQNESFEAGVDVEGLSDPFRGVFIRAPWVEKVGAEVEVLGSVDDHPVMVRQGRILATSFHPELTGDGRIHQMLLDLI